MFLLKIQYEKYFSGLEKIEPLKEREELRRVVRDLMREFIPNTRQRHNAQPSKPVSTQWRCTGRETWSK